MEPKQLAKMIRAIETLHDFVQYMWEELEPMNPVEWGWHMTLICDYLTASYNGELETDDADSTFVCNIPPRLSKSTLFGVYGPAWDWLHNPHHQFLCLTANDKNRKRDARLMRRLVKSKRYRALVRLKHLMDGSRLWNCSGSEPLEGQEHGFTNATDEQDTIDYFTNSVGGHRVSLTTGSSVIGQGCHILVIDDPHDAADVANGTPDQINARMKEIQIKFDEVWLSRINLGSSLRAVQIVMQRLHEADLAGYLLKKGAISLCLPAEYESSHPYKNEYDPRQEGELISDRLLAAREKIKKDSLQKWAGQYQQRPSAKEGGKFKRNLWVRYEGRPSLMAASAVLIYITVDCADKTGKDNAYSVLHVVGKHKTKTGIVTRVYDEVRGKFELPELIESFRALCLKWPKATVKLIEDEHNGTALIQLMQREMTGIVAVKPKGDKTYPGGSKEDRAQYTLASLQAGNGPELPQDEYAMTSDGSWAQGIIEEHANFPNGIYKDRVDTISQVSIRIMTDEQKSYPEKVQEKFGWLNLI